LRSAVSMSEKIRNVTCACGAVQVELEGEALFSGTCHCDDCQKATGSAFNQAAFWPIDKVTVTQGDKLLKMWMVRTTPRYSCSVCSNMIYMAPPTQPLFGFNGALISDYKPLFHMQTKFGKVKVLDSTAKFAGLPPTLGGKVEFADWALPSKRAMIARTFNKPADKVYSYMADWTQESKFGLKISYTGPEGVGRVREWKNKDGLPVRQLLLSKDDALKRVSYAFTLNPPSPDLLGVPLVMDIVPVGNGDSCCLTYTALLKNSVSDEQSGKIAAGMAGAVDKSFAPDIGKL